MHYFFGFFVFALAAVVFVEAFDEAFDDAAVLVSLDDAAFLDEGAVFGDEGAVFELFALAFAVCLPLTSDFTVADFSAAFEVVFFLCSTPLTADLPTADLSPGFFLLLSLIATHT